MTLAFFRMTRKLVHLKGSLQSAVWRCSRSKIVLSN